MSKKVIKIAVIIVLVIFAFIGLENMFKSTKKSIEIVKNNKEQEEIKEAYEKSHESKVEQYLSNCVDLSISLLASGDFDAMYTKLDETYKDYMQFTTVDDFKNFMNEYIGVPISADLISQREEDGKYVCEVNIQTETSTNLHNVIIEPMGEDYRITFGDITQILPLEGNYRELGALLDCDIIYKVKESNSWVYAVEVINYSNKTIKGSFSKSYLRRTDREDYVAVNGENYNDVELKPGESIRMNLRFKSAKEHYVTDDNLYLIYEGDDATKDTINIIMYHMYWL